ncbi:MAG: FMN-binding glutamate synthase family protein [Gaiella sp.]
MATFDVTPALRESYLYDRGVIAEIQRAAREGIYDIRGFGAKRRLPHFDDLLFLGASVSRYPLEGYRERCATDVVLGDRFARRPLHLKIPITIAGMSFGALSAPAKEALGRGASEVGTSTTTGDGGMTPEERQHSELLVYQLLPSRYGMNPDDLRKADAIEVVVGQGAKPGGGGMLLGHKISDRVAQMRDLPKGIDQRSACRHPDWTGPDDLEIKLHELRELTDWEKPVFVKVGATRTYYDTQLAVKAGADVIVVDGMQGGTAATQDVFIEHVGIPTLAAIPLAVQALQELDMHRKVQLVVSGGIRTGADVAKALALGADAVSIGVAALIAMGDNAPELDEEYRRIGSASGFYDDWQAGRDPAGISTQDDELAARFDPVLGGRKLANYLRVLTLETQTLARACGKSHVHNLEPEDLVALTIEASLMTGLPLAGMQRGLVDEIAERVAERLRG